MPNEDDTFEMNYIGITKTYRMDWVGSRENMPMKTEELYPAFGFLHSATAFQGRTIYALNPALILPSGFSISHEVSKQTNSAAIH